jgi:hypothetical protein
MENSNKRRKTFDIDNLVSATRVVNYTRDDSIIDYLDLVNKNGYTVSENTLTLEKNNKKETKKRKSSFDYIVEAGYKFEEKIIKKIKKNMEQLKLSNKIITIDKDIDINKQFEKTSSVIKEYKYHVIFGGLLINNKNSTYGYPDMIVLGSWINKFIECPPTSLDENLYYIIDIKSSTINLINEGKYVSSSNLFEGYKTQIWVYTEALEQIQKCESKYGFILGKKYKYKQDGKEIIINNEFYMLGLVDYLYEKTKGNDIKTNVDKSVKWFKELRKNWKKYKLNPISKKITINMKNSFDKHHKKIKKCIAYKNHELTCLWNCGTTQKKHALKSNITKYSDPKLTPDKLGFKSETSKYNIIDTMISMTNSKKLISIPKTNNYNNWRNPVKYEFFVDFETYIPTKIIDETEIFNNEQDKQDKQFIPEYNEFNESQYIYMIGVGFFSNSTYNFKCFIINYHGSNEIYKNIKKHHNCKASDIVYVDNEKSLIESFVNYIYSFKNKNIPKYKFLKETRLIHWSWAEPSLFYKSLVKHNINNIHNIFPWNDLMAVFKNKTYPIIIKNCFSFSLKEITKSMHNYKMIDLVWPDLDDGLLSAFIASDIYKENNVNVKSSNNNMHDIIEYNYIDCKALYCILTFIRNHNTNHKLN